jgi:hemerythrin-like domain-containing protein
VAEMQLTGQIDADLLRATVDFIRGYADRYHHMKEEDVLFDYTDPQAKMVQVILQDHTRARGIVADIDRAVKEGDLQTLCARLTEYRALLTEHITKEDEVLYPYIDRGLTVSQVGEIYRRFEESETQVPEGTREKYERFITDLTVRYEREMALS